MAMWAVPTKTSEITTTLCTRNYILCSCNTKFENRFCCDSFNLLSDRYNTIAGKNVHVICANISPTTDNQLGPKS